MSIKNFQLVRLLGEGAYSSVYLVRRLEDGQEYALKKVKMLNLSEKERENALNEIRILASIKHPNIVQYKEAFLEEDTNQLCIVMEYADNGDLYQKIVDQKKQGQLFKEEDIWNIFIQVVKGMKELHWLKIFHRDLKSANVFLCKDGMVKLGDMNVSKVAKKGLLFTQTGTPYYASPEVWKEKPYDNKSDIWSLGCVLYEMTTLKPPFRAEDMEGLYKKVTRGFYPKIPSHYSQDLNNVIRALLQVSPSLRPSAEKILLLPAVQSRLNNSQCFLVETDENSILLQTIRIPKKMNTISSLMPKPNYSVLQTYSRTNNTANQFQNNLSNYHSQSIHNNSIVIRSNNQPNDSSALPTIPHSRHNRPYIEHQEPHQKYKLQKIYGNNKVNLKYGVRVGTKKVVDLSSVSVTPGDHERHMAGLEINYNAIKGTRKGGMLPSIASHNQIEQKRMGIEQKRMGIEQKRMGPINQRLGNLIAQSRIKKRLYP